MNGFWLDLNRFLCSDPAQVLLQGIQRNPAEIKALTAAQDGRQHPLRIGGGQHEHHLWWWFLQRFQECVEGGGGEHVAFVHHIHLPTGLDRRKARAFDQLTDVVDTRIGGGIDLDHV